MLKIWRVYDLPYKYFSPQIGTFYGLVFGLILWGLRHFQQYFSFYWRSVLLVEETGLLSHEIEKIVDFHFVKIYR
jgi:hypothetical protein